MQKISCVYIIMCQPNRHYYIGSTNNLYRRWKDHVTLLTSNKHANMHMQHCWNKYGIDAFSIHTLRIVDVQDLFLVETEYLKRHVGTDGCMNISMDAQSVWRGISKSANHRSNIAKGMRQYYREHPEVRLVQRNARIGHNLSQTTKDRMRHSKKRGIAHHNSKLTDQSVRQIRQLYVPHEYSYGKLADQFGVDKKTIVRIIQYKTWTHLT